MFETPYYYHQNYYNGLGMGSVTNMLEISSNMEGVGEGMDYDHYPLLLEIVLDMVKLPSSFKFDSTWLDDDEFNFLVF